jgi:hypothetical protein
MQQPQTTTKERSIGKKYASLLQVAIRSAINQEQKSFTTLALKTKVSHKMKNGQLQRLVLDSPKHSFVQHHGFEGIRKNGRYLQLKEKNHLMAFRSINVLNGLADEIGSVRAEKVIAQINF